MDEVRKAALIVGCQQAILRFYSALDRSDYDSLAAAMAPEGVWHRQGRALRGPDEVLAAVRASVRPGASRRTSCRTWSLT